MSGPLPGFRCADAARARDDLILGSAPRIDRWLLLAGRWTLLSAGAAFATALFLGGGDGPLLPDWLWTTAKTAALLSGFVLLRRRLPVVRPERLAEVAWVAVLPLVLLQVLLVSIVVVGRG